jgi:hypothetical protein
MAADCRQDRALVALKSQVRALQLRPVADVALAAKRVYLMLKNYGKVYNKPFGAKTGDLCAILDLLNGEYAAAVALLALSAWKDELQDASAQFLRMLALRNAESLQKPPETFRTVRYGIEKVYHRITGKVNAGAALNISPACDAFINRLNPVIDRLNEEFHHVRRNISHAQPEGIPPQTFTGRLRLRLPSPTQCRTAKCNCCNPARTTTSPIATTHRPATPAVSFMASVSTPKKRPSHSTSCRHNPATPARQPTTPPQYLLRPAWFCKAPTDSFRLRLR